MSVSYHQDGTQFTVAIAGKFTFASNAEFRDILLHIQTKTPKQIVIDLSETELVDSAALGMLLLAREKAQSVSAEIVLLSAQGQPKKMLDVSNFRSLFTIR